ncbi:S41 family peptidase [Prevotella sp. 10(H)]|uniref:S41 family peptidase n=1 Tax=Prevotella sp. 10(H) TaxID=1158294 RepID=UPI0004A77229|nr:S41 family peptidase [Prevotella sp. 10(H)]
MKKLIVIFTILNIGLCSAQTRFTRQQLINDADTLYQAINEIHPNPYYQYSKKDFDREFNELKHNLRDSMTSMDFYNLITPLVAKLNDGHTNITPYASRSQEQKLFPFRINISDKHEIFVIDSYGKTKLPKGTQITYINGKNSKDIIKELLRYIFGETDYFKKNYLQLKFSDYYANTYGYSSFKIGYIDEQGKSRNMDTNGVDTDVVEKALGSLLSFEKTLDLTLDETNKIAILSFNSCDIPVEFAQDFFKTSFDSINKMGIEYLIIDARFNGGGTDLVGNDLLMYISDVPFKQYDGTDTKISYQLAKSHPWYQNNEAIWDRLRKEGPFIIPKEEEDRYFLDPYPDSVRFHGKKFLLTGFLNFSAATDFSWAFWKFGLGTVIGEETGGLGHSFGASLNSVLPNTRLKYNVSNKLFYNYKADKNSVHGVKPDIEIPYEEALDYTINAIKNGKL